jgi:hypothetical protein
LLSIFCNVNKRYRDVHWKNIVGSFVLGFLMFIPAFRTAFTLHLQSLPEEQRKHSSWVSFLYGFTGTFLYVSDSNTFQ